MIICKFSQRHTQLPHMDDFTLVLTCPHGGAADHPDDPMEGSSDFPVVNDYLDCSIACPSSSFTCALGKRWQPFPVPSRCTFS